LSKIKKYMERVAFAYEIMTKRGSQKSFFLSGAFMANE
jgi:hypothetical protein